MFSKSKSQLFVFLFASLVVHSACTKDAATEDSTLKSKPSQSTEVAAPPSTTEVAKDSAAAFSPIYFAFDSSAVESNYHDELQKLAEQLKTKASAKVQVEGNCDERGSNQYNLALGARRAEAVKAKLVQMGASDSNVTTISYGKEKPVAEGHTEEDWQKNRRADLKM